MVRPSRPIPAVVDRVPGPARRRPGGIRTTPGRLRLLAGASIAAALGLLAVFAVAVADAHNGLKRIGHHDGPIVVATSNLYFALADMDAQIANVLLVGERGEPMQTYEKRRDEVASQLQRTGAIAGDNQAIGTELRAVLVALGRYEGLAAQAILANRPTAAGPPPSGPAPPAEAGRTTAAALELYRRATGVMHEELLPAAKRLTDRSVALVGSHYAHAQSATTGAVAIVATVGLLVLSLLGGLQLFLIRRHRRLLNPPLAIGTLATLVLLLTGLNAVTDSEADLRAVKEDAFNSIVALQQARAVSYDANADKSRYLLDPGNAVRYERDFGTKSMQLLDAGVGDDVDRYNDALRRTLDDYRRYGGRATFGGYFGSAMRNITFPGEGFAASQTLARYQEYQLVDREVRRLNAQGKRAEAIRLATGTGSGDSNGRFAAYDSALVDFIGINTTAFTRLVNDGDRLLTRWNWLPDVVLIPVALLVVVGVRPRLAEYRP